MVDNEDPTLLQLSLNFLNFRLIYGSREFILKNQSIKFGAVELSK